MQLYSYAKNYIAKRISRWTYSKHGLLYSSRRQAKGGRDT